MQKILCLIAISFFAVNLSFGQTTEGKDSVLNYTDINGNKQGQWIQYYDEAKEAIRYTGFFIDNIPQGIFKHYHPNGRIKAVQEFDKNGSSIVEFFWENGNPAARGNFDPNRERIGNWFFFYAYGEKQRKVKFEQGKRQGEEITYYKNGQILTKYNYVDDIRHGAYTFYFENGNIREEGQYVNGVKQGKFNLYLPDGNLDEKGEYIDDHKEGNWLIANQDDSFDTVEYRKGVRTDRDSLESEFWKRAQWAKDHQEEFKKPEDYLDNPFEFFK